MSDTLQVGVQTNCTAPLRLERVSLRLSQLFGADPMFLPDHYVSLIPRSVWKPEFTPAAKIVSGPAIWPSRWITYCGESAPSGGSS